MRGISLASVILMTAPNAAHALKAPAPIPPAAPIVCIVDAEEGSDFKKPHACFTVMDDHSFNMRKASVRGSLGLGFSSAVATPKHISEIHLIYYLRDEHLSEATRTNLRECWRRIQEWRNAHMPIPLFPCW